MISSHSDRATITRHPSINECSSKSVSTDVSDRKSFGPSYKLVNTGKEPECPGERNSSVCEEREGRQKEQKYDASPLTIDTGCRFKFNCGRPC